MLDLPHQQAISAAEKTRLNKAHSTGKWACIGIQLPVIYLGVRLFDRIVSKLPWEKKIIWYLVGAQCYYAYYSLSKAFVWNNVFATVEDIVKLYVEQMTEEQIQQVRSEQIASAMGSKS